MLNRELCNLPGGQNGISAVLKLSYNSLPPHLKGCFGFCAIFPKDYEFDKNELWSTRFLATTVTRIEANA
ncbi:hypothetical protein SLA2020_016260 [Shorea laevis]